MPKLPTADDSEGAVEAILAAFGGEERYMVALDEWHVEAVMRSERSTKREAATTGIGVSA